jgi:tetratricopeptide (TPR) repeat protein
LRQVSGHRLIFHARQAAQIALRPHQRLDAMPPRRQLARQIGADESRRPREKTIHAQPLYTRRRPAIFQANSGKKLNGHPRQPVNNSCPVRAMPKKINSPRKKLTRQELRDLDLEILFLEGVVRRDPAYIEALQILGDDYTRRGRYPEGLKVDERLSLLHPEDAVVQYNLACSYSLTQQTQLAFEALEAAINLGYRDFKSLDKDPDLDNLRQHDDFKRIRAKIRGLQAKTP